jgi:hypothetical protein
MERSNHFKSYKAIITLFILSPLIAELFGGSTPVSRAGQLPLEAVFYGSGALLIREFIRRNNLGWLSILLAGIAFGIIEEGLSTQSLFNPNFLGNDLALGRSWGVNWVWAEVIIVYHAVWSITIPIIFAELLFPSIMHKPWLNKYGLIGFSMLFILGATAFIVIFLKTSGFHTSVLNYIIAGILVITFVLLSRYKVLNFCTGFSFKTPSCFLVGLISFFAGALWFTFLTSVFVKGFGLPPWGIAVLALSALVLYFILVTGWSNSHWNNKHLYAAASGGLIAIELFGLSVLKNFNNKIDIICQIIFIIGTVILLFVLFKKVQPETSAE